MDELMESIAESSSSGIRQTWNKLEQSVLVMVKKFFFLKPVFDTVHVELSKMAPLAAKK